MCVRLWGRPGSLLCTDPALQSVIRPVSCFSLARIHTEEETHRLLCIVILLSVSTFQFPFSPLIPPLSISLLFDTAHFFTHPPLSTSTHPPALFFQWVSPPPSILSVSLLSSYVVSCPRNLFRSQPEIFCRSTIRIGSCRKTTSEGTSGSRRLADPDPKPAVYLQRHTRLCASSSFSADLGAVMRGCDT